MLRRDPRLGRYRRRLAASYLASLVIHVLVAASFFTMLSNAAQQGATEAVQNGTIVVLERSVPAVAHAPRIAPARPPKAAVPARHPLPPLRRELSQFAPTAPPLPPTPQPRSTVLPTVQPTQAAYAPNPRNELPAVPSSAPTAVAVAVTLRATPTAAPTQAPTQAPTRAPTQPPTQAPAPAPTQAPTAMPSARSTPAPVAAASPGPPEPRPTPGATGVPSAAPLRGGLSEARPAPVRPVAIAPTPAPAPTPKPTPSPRRSAAPDINARLRALLPNGPVVPHASSYHPQITLRDSLEPTPPPEVVAATRYTIEERGAGRDVRTKMWVTSIRHDGPMTTCVGWLVRYPQAVAPSYVHSILLPANGTQVGGAPPGTGPPIVEERAQIACSERDLVPFSPPASPSP